MNTQSLRDHIDIFYGPPLSIISDCLRGFITAKPGHDLIGADYSAIEARVLPWLAGEESVLDIFRTTGKIYEHAAAGIYNVRMEDVTKEQRQVGKVACIAEGSLVLTDSGLVPIEDVTTAHRVWDGTNWVSHDGVVFKGIKECIYYDGVTATEDHIVFTKEGRHVPFGVCAREQIPLATTGADGRAIRMGSNSIPENNMERPLRQTKKLEGNPKATSSFRVYDIINAGPKNRFTVSNKLVHNCLALGYQGGKGAFQNMARAYGLKVSDYEAENIKTAWRKRHPNIQRYWHKLEEAAIDAVLNPGKTYTAGPIVSRQVKYKVSGSFLFCLLPSKRALCYPYPKVEDVQMPWGDSKRAITFMAENSLTHKWERTKTYGGSLAENNTQAVARDILAQAMLKLEGTKYEVVMHVHDEILCEVKKGEGSVEELENIMSESPAWAKDLPLEAEGFRATRYQK